MKTGRKLTAVGVISGALLLLGVASPSLAEAGTVVLTPSGVFTSSVAADGAAGALASADDDCPPDPNMPWCPTPAPIPSPTLPTATLPSIPTIPVPSLPTGTSAPSTPAVPLPSPTHSTPSAHPITPPGNGTGNGNGHPGHHHQPGHGDHPTTDDPAGTVPDSSESTDTNSTNTCEDPVLCNSSDPVAAPVAATAAAQPEKGAATLPDTGAPSGTGELALLGFGLVGAGLVLLRRRPARHRG